MTELREVIFLWTLNPHRGFFLKIISIPDRSSKDMQLTGDYLISTAKISGLVFCFVRKSMELF
jgi:hypothetical protein